MEEVERQLLELVTWVYDTFQWPGVVFLMAIESASIPLPSEIIMPLSGWLLIQDKGLSVFYVLLAGFYGAVGNLLGSLLAYWVGAKGGRPLLERYGKYLLISMRDLERGDAWFRRHGELTVFFSRLLPVVRTFISFPAGVARMNLARFSLYTLAGSFPWSVGLAYGGFKLGANWESLRAAMRPFDIPILMAILVLVALYVWRHLRHTTHPAQEDEKAIGATTKGPQPPDR